MTFIDALACRVCGYTGAARRRGEKRRMTAHNDADWVDAAVEAILVRLNQEDGED